MIGQIVKEGAAVDWELIWDVGWADIRFILPNAALL